ncbi:hypothetical protein, partial [Varibaculum sp.]|uniref:hypothetical protein n=1 Tax=Varibaculum sp. TaxID=1895474 RepID=UPI0025F765C5
TCLRLQVFGQMTWDIKRVFPYYKRTQVLKDLKTPTPRKTDTSPETTQAAVPGEGTIRMNLV